MKRKSDVHSHGIELIELYAQSIESVLADAQLQLAIVEHAHAQPDPQLSSAVVNQAVATYSKALGQVDQIEAHLERWSLAPSLTAHEKAKVARLQSLVPTMRATYAAVRERHLAYLPKAYEENGNAASSDSDLAFLP